MGPPVKTVKLLMHSNLAGDGRGPCPPASCTSQVHSVATVHGEVGSACGGLFTLIMYACEHWLPTSGQCVVSILINQFDEKPYDQYPAQDAHHDAIIAVVTI